MISKYAAEVSETMNRFKFNYNNKEFDFHEPRVMAIINLTPDSFYDGGKYSSLTFLLKDVEEKIRQGAYIVDLGSQSTRPGADMIDAEEEWNRLKEPLKHLRFHFPDIRISVDTFHALTARHALAEGADMINDVSGMQWESGMEEVLRHYQCPYVLMHSRGTPDRMANDSNYDDPIREIAEYFIHKLHQLESMGIHQIILDPGFGFAKNIRVNFLVLKNLHRFSGMGYPVLAGLSRKSMIYQTLQTTPTDALNGTTALNMIALMQGTRILRVHDVREAVQTIQLWKSYENA